MFKTTNLKLYRKFLILAVMIGGLFMVTSINQAGTEAWGCCSTCEEDHNNCVEACYNPNPDKWKECIHNECQSPYFYCLMHCDMGC